MACSPSVLPSVQLLEVEEPRVTRRFHGAFHPRVWVHVLELDGCYDEELLPYLGKGRPVAGRALCGFSVSGRSFVRFGSGRRVTIEPGDGVFCQGRSAFRSRAESTDAPAISINIDWDADYFGAGAPASPSRFSLGSKAGLSERVDALRTEIARAWEHAALAPSLAASVSDLLAFLRASGLAVPVVRPADLETSFDADVQRASRAFDRAFSQTRDLPMLIDVEASLGLSARTIQRAMPRVVRAWGRAPVTFRELRTQVQLGRGCLLMSHPQATTERVADLLGFSTANALCRSFAKSGLPSPGRVRERLADLLQVS